MSIKGNLLLVDDEPMILENLVELFDGFADKIFVAENGQKALDIINENSIHAVLCDINMPIMNGVELISLLRIEGNNVPFIFYTGHGNEKLMREAAKYGAFDFLNKPALDGVFDIVKSALKFGLDQNESEVSENNFISDYKKMVTKLSLE